MGPAPSRNGWEILGDLFAFRWYMSLGQGRVDCTEVSLSNRPEIAHPVLSGSLSDGTTSVNPVFGPHVTDHRSTVVVRTRRYTRRSRFRTEPLSNCPEATRAMLCGFASSHPFRSELAVDILVPRAVVYSDHSATGLHPSRHPIHSVGTTHPSRVSWPDWPPEVAIFRDGVHAVAHRRVVRSLRGFGSGVRPALDFAP